ncbi:hypothetical protein CLOP_g1210 [Closterium sp. NIES-67]|nr:hypothetical protein CLOP_g1210 [Closterium sp. NIES-67]
MDRSALDRPMIDRRMMLLSRSRREQEGDSDSEEAYSIGRDDVDRSDSLSRAFAQQTSVRDYRGGGGDSRQVRQEEEEEEDEEEYTVEVWDALDSLEQLKPIIASGPRWKLEEFLRAIDILQEMAEFFERNECASGVRECDKFMAVAMDHLLDEFRDALAKISKPLPAAMLREVAMSTQAGRLVDQHQGGAAAAAAAVLAGAAGGGVPRTSTGSSSASSHLPSSRSRTGNPASSSPDSSGSSSPTAGGSAAPHAVSAATHQALQDWLSASAVPFLHRMAVKLAQGGESQRCMQQYVKVRAEAIQRSVDALDIKRVLTSSLEEMTWQQLEALMKGWVTDMRAMVLVLLGSERVLCDEIFDSLEPDRELCYLSLIQASGLAATVEGGGEQRACGGVGAQHAGAPLCAARYVHHGAGAPGADRGGGVGAGVWQLQTRAGGAACTPPGAEPGQKERDAEAVSAQCECERRGRGGPVEEMEVATAATHPLTSYVVNYMNNLLDKQSKRNYPVTLEYLLLEYGRSITATGTDATAAALITRSGPQYKTPFSGAAVERRSGAVGPAALGQRAATLAGVVSSVLESLLRCLEARSRAASDPTQGALFLLNNALYISKNLSDGKLSAVADLPDWKDGQMLDKYMIHFRDARAR